jgi:hypothetical protein
MKGLEVQSVTNEVQTIWTGSDPKFESEGAGEMDLLICLLYSIIG